MPVKLQNLKQGTTIKGTPAAIYESLMDSAKHAAFTGMEATILFEEGGPFETCAGRNFGYTLVLVPDKKIVQAWRHNDWPIHHFSIIVFELKKSGAATKLSFTQSGIPESSFEWIKSGWRSTYWKPLKAYVEKNAAAALDD